MGTRKFIQTFFSTSVILLLGLIYFVTWIDPMKILNLPWSNTFISDRNSSYIKFTRLKESSTFTDVIVGSSTSEVILPKTILEKKNVNAFLAGDGGSPTALRLIYIREALKTQPHLKRIIYVADFFEFEKAKIENRVFYQPEMMNYFGSEDLKHIDSPAPIDRIYDFISQETIRNAFKTFSDYQKYQKGTYKSQYFADGTTEKSMLAFNSKEPLEYRTLRLAKSYKNIFGEMTQLSEHTKYLYQKIIEEASAHSVQLIIVIAPWHTDLYKYYEPTHAKLYTEWVAYLHSLASEHVQIVDFSYPTYLEKGITDKDHFWHDGAHFSKDAALFMLDEIYKN